MQIRLHVSFVIGAIEPVEEKRNPGRSSFEKGDSQLRETVKHAVRHHGRRLNHEPERMAQRVRGIVGAEGVEPETMQATNMDRQRATEFFRCFINRKVNLRAQVAVDALSVRGQHAAQHSEFLHASTQLFRRGVNVLDGDERHTLQPRADS